MDYSEFVHALRSASIFDLYRLRAAISQQLDNPDRIEDVRARLKPGMVVDYFDETENRLIKATVIELNRTRLVVANQEDGKRWSIKFCMVNLAGVPVDIHPASTQQPLDRSSLRVGDMIGFRDKQNREKFGRIHDLNQKTVSVVTTNGERWRVGYRFLFTVLEAG